MELRPWVRNALWFSAGYLFGKHNTQQRYQRVFNQMQADPSPLDYFEQSPDVEYRIADLRRGLILTGSVVKELLRRTDVIIDEEEFSAGLQTQRQRYLTQPFEQRLHTVLKPGIWKLNNENGAILREMKPFLENRLFPMWDNLIRDMGDDALDFSRSPVIPNTTTESVYEAVTAVMSYFTPIISHLCRVDNDAKDAMEEWRGNIETVLNTWRAEGRPETYTRTGQMLLDALRSAV